MNSLSMFLSILIVSAFSVSQALTANCHLKELDFCAASLIVQLQNQATPTTDGAIDSYCKTINEALSCVSNYTSKCSTPLQKELIDYATIGGIKILKEFCTAGSPLRVNYLTHAKCLSEAKAESRRCTRDLQVAVEEALSTSWEKRIPLACCSFNRFQDCYLSIVKTRCGSEAIDLGRKIMSISTSRLPETVCRSYVTKSPLCVNILPATGEVPKGNKSDSLVARLFASALGN